jgi:hypothetical protein
MGVVTEIFTKHKAPRGLKLILIYALGPVTAKNVPIAFTSGAAIFSRFANWLLASSWVEREGMG